MMEKWALIKEFPDYMVSTLGRVRSKRPRGHHAKNGNSNSKIWRFIKMGARQQVILCNKDGKFPMLVPRLVALAFIKNTEPDTYKYVLHKDDNRLNNTVDNLYWGTQKMNLADSKRNNPNWKDKFLKIEESKRQSGYYERKKPHSQETRARISATNIATKTIAGRIKLTEEMVIEIRRTSKNISTRYLADKYGVPIRTMWRVRSGRSWKFVNTATQGTRGV